MSTNFTKGSGFVACPDPGAHIFRGWWIEAHGSHLFVKFLLLVLLDSCVWISVVHTNYIFTSKKHWRVCTVHTCQAEVEPSLH